MLRGVFLGLAALVIAVPAAAAGTGFGVDDAPPPVTNTVMISPLALEAGSISSFGETPQKKSSKKKSRHEAAPEGMPLGPERARILLRSLTVPGWGQATLGHRHAAATFAVLEGGIWTAFTAFRIQEQMRTLSYEHTAMLFAGIDVRGRDEEFRRIVGAFASSDEYNLLVVARDAANLYMQDINAPDMAGYRAYIAAHSLTGRDAWAWTNEASFDRYHDQRENAQRASINANTALALAIANRLVSALHAAREAGHVHTAAPTGTSWNFEFAPGDLGEQIVMRAGLHARF
jgi:hypothetical protein